MKLFTATIFFALFMAIIAAPGPAPEMEMASPTFIYSVVSTYSCYLRSESLVLVTWR